MPRLGRSRPASAYLYLSRAATAPFTVQAGETGSTDIGISLYIAVLTGQAGSPIGASTAALTSVPALTLSSPAGTGSFVYGSCLALGSGAFTPNGATTTKYTNTGSGLEFIDTRLTGTTTAGTGVTVGGSMVGNSISMALLEILSGTGLAEDASSPGGISAASQINVTSSAFAPPAGSLLVASIQSNGNTGTCTMTVTDTSGLGLTWVEQVVENAAGHGYCGIWTATMPGGAPPPVALAPYLIAQNTGFF